MDNNKIYHVLADAVATIEAQKKEIMHLRYKADAYSRIGQLLDLTSGQQGQGEAWGGDPLHSLRVAMEEIHTGLVAEKAAADATNQYPYPDEIVGMSVEQANRAGCLG